MEDGKQIALYQNRQIREIRPAGNRKVARKSQDGHMMEMDTYEDTYANLKRLDGRRNHDVSGVERRQTNGRSGGI